MLSIAVILIVLGLVLSALGGLWRKQMTFGSSVMGLQESMPCIAFQLGPFRHHIGIGHQLNKELNWSQWEVRFAWRPRTVLTKGSWPALYAGIGKFRYKIVWLRYYKERQTNMGFVNHEPWYQTMEV